LRVAGKSVLARILLGLGWWNISCCVVSEQEKDGRGSGQKSKEGKEEKKVSVVALFRAPEYLL